MEEGVTFEELWTFLDEFGVTNDPFVIDVLNNLNSHNINQRQQNHHSLQRNVGGANDYDANGTVPVPFGEVPQPSLSSTGRRAEPDRRHTGTESLPITSVVTENAGQRRLEIGRDGRVRLSNEIASPGDQLGAGPLPGPSSEAK